MNKAIQKTNRNLCVENRNLCVGLDYLSPQNFIFVSELY